MIKKEARFIGIDDAPFKKTDKKVLVIGVVYRGGEFIEGVISTTITKDGDDATRILGKKLLESRFYSQLKAVFLGGVTIAGFNIVDIEELSRTIDLPVIAVTRKYPDYLNDEILNELNEK